MRSACRLKVKRYDDATNEPVRVAFVFFSARSEGYLLRAALHTNKEISTSRNGYVQFASPTQSLPYYAFSHSCSVNRVLQNETGIATLNIDMTPAAVTVLRQTHTKAWCHIQQAKRSTWYCLWSKCRVKINMLCTQSKLAKKDFRLQKNEYRLYSACVVLRYGGAIK